MIVKIYNKISKVLVEAEIKHKHNEGRQIQIAHIYADDILVGQMYFMLKDDNVHIFKLQNLTPGIYGNVGVSLVNYAFDLSLANGKEGRITIVPVSESVIFWEKLGFEFTSDKDMHLPDKAIKARLDSEEYKMKKIKKWAEANNFKVFHDRDESPASLVTSKSKETQNIVYKK